MNCDWIKDNVVLFIYDELPDDARFEFEQHVQRCIGCRRELDAAREFKNDMSAFPVQDVSPNFLTSNRMELQEALEHAQQQRSAWGMFVFDFAGWMSQLKLAPALCSALLMIGFAAGTLTTYQIVTRNLIPQSPTQGNQAAEATITGIQSIAPQANSNRVSITYDTV